MKRLSRKAKLQYLDRLLARIEELPPAPAPIRLHVGLSLSFDPPTWDWPAGK